MNMASFDTEKARQVWQRVQDRGVPPLHRQNPGELLGLSWIQERLYWQLGQGLPAGLAGRFRDYARQSRSWGDCLRGICCLADIHPRQERQRPVQPEPAREILKRALAGERQLVTEFASRTADGDWGRVYELLGKQATIRCTGLLEILGREFFAQI